MKRLVALVAVAFVAATFAVTPVGAAKPVPALLGVTSELGLNCTVEATAQVGDLRGKYYVYFVVKDALVGGQIFATADVRTSPHDTSVVAQLPLTSPVSATAVLAYLHTGPIDGRWDTVGFVYQENLDYTCGM